MPGLIPLSRLLIAYSVGVVLMSCGVIFFIMVFWQLPLVRGEVQAGQVRLAATVTAQFSEILERVERVAQCAAVLFDAGAPGENALITTQVDECARHDSGVRAVYLLDGQARVAAVGHGLAVEDSGLTGQSIVLPEFFKRQSSVSGVRWSNSFISPLDGSSREAVLYRHVGHMVLVELRRDEMVRLAKQFSRDELEVLILDDQGHIIANGMSEVHLPFDIQISPLAETLKQGTFQLISQKVNEQEMTGVIHPVPDLQLQVLVLQPSPGIEISARMMGRMLASVLIIILLIAIFSSALIATAFKRQFRRLEAFAETIKQGEYTLRWAGSKIVEFNDLARAFVEMGDAIHSREVAVAEGQVAYREILESTTDLAVKISGRGKIIYANPAFCRLLGMTLEELVGKPLTIFLRDNDDSSWRVAAGLNPGSGSIAFESFIVAANQHAYRIAWTVHAGYGENAKKAYAAIGRDISDQWHVSEALRRSEARLRTMLENATTVAIQWYDVHGRVIYWGPGAEKLYGYSSANAVGRGIEQLHFSENKEVRFTEICNRIAVDVGTYGPEKVTVMHADGRVLDVMMTVFSMPAEDGGAYFVCMDVDISEQVKEAAARREAERWFATVFQASPVAMAVWRYRELYDANAAWEELFDMSVDEGRLATKGGESAGFWEDSAVRAAFIEQLFNEGEVEAVSAWISGKNGVRRLCQVSGRAVDLDGVVMWIVAYKDITAKHEAGEKLRELNETLEQRVAERTQALYRANHELSAALDHLNTTQAELIRSEKMAALGSLVAGVAHELSTPLGNSLLAANTLRDHARELSKEMESGLRRSTLERYLAETQDGNEIIERNLSRAAELVSSFKQVAVDQSSSQRRRFMLMEVVEEIMMTLRPSLKRLPFIVNIDVDPGLEFDSYPGPLGQVLTNLINNAIIHAFDGRDHGVITITGRADGEEYVLLEVTDDGTGIPEANLRRLFDPFFTTRFGEGSGLGLPIVHSLITNLLGGLVEVSSVPGQGACFRFRLPKIAPTSGRGV